MPSLAFHASFPNEYILAVTAWTNSHAVASVLGYLSSQALPRYGALSAVTEKSRKVFT